MQISTFDALLYTSVALLPGFIICGIVDAINPPSKQPEYKYFLKCLLYSIISCGCWSWLLYMINESTRITPIGRWILMVITSIVGSSFIGFIIAVVKQKEIIRKIADRLKINTFPSTPTAWDYFFSKQEPCFVIVTLLDGKILQGWYGGDSFASSSPEERDIYLELNFNENWEPDKEGLGVYIQKDQIKYIEFKKGEENE